MNKRKSGEYYETKVCEYLTDKGVRILERNFRSKNGEIDIIFRDGKYLVFAEVKFRSTVHFGRPEEAVSFSKQRTISRVSDFYRKRYGISDFEPQRFDVIAMEPGEDDFLQIKWYKNAFAYIR